jgi:hypothetical protein
MDSEKELLEAFERIIHEDFPNPQRIDCPGHEALLKLAEGARAFNRRAFWATSDNALLVSTS